MKYAFVHPNNATTNPLSNKRAVHLAPKLNISETVIRPHEHAMFTDTTYRDLYYNKANFGGRETAIRLSEAGIIFRDSRADATPESVTESWTEC